VLKSDIEIAPVHHRLPERIRAYALICFLALVLHRVMRQRLQAAGSKFSPHRALALLRQIQRHSVCVNGRPASGVGRLISPVRGKVLGMARNRVVLPGFAAFHLGEEASEQQVVSRAQSGSPGVDDEDGGRDAGDPDARPLDDELDQD